MKTLRVLLLLALPLSLFSQKLKYKSDIEPLLKAKPNSSQINNLQIYYEQGLDKDGNPTKETLNYQRDRMTIICYRLADIYKQYAYSNKDYPTTDTAIGAINTSIYWYKTTQDKLFNKSDTLPKHISNLEALKPIWKEEEQKTIAEIKALKNKFEADMTEIAKLDDAEFNRLNGKYSKLIYLNEYKKANKEVSASLSKLLNEKQALEDKMKAAQQRKVEMQAEMKKNEQQKEFLRLQNLCAEENPCPNCPLDVAKAFRDAYYAGNLAAMKSLIVDYYGDEKLFYNKDINLYQQLSDEDSKKYSLKFRALTQDFKKTDPENVVYYTDNEKKDFFIDKNYKSYFLHATVFSAINDYDKIDLIKYNGKWKVYRVGGAYGGRTGKTICNGSFFHDERFLQKEIKTKKKK